MYDNYKGRDSVYKTEETELLKSINKNLDALICGSTIEKGFELFSMYHLLRQIGNEGIIDLTKEDIVCMEDLLFCHGVGTVTIDSTYPVGPEGSGSNDGIDFMQVLGDGVLHPVNRIRE